jgi:hypothetical protein
VPTLSTLKYLGLWPFLTEATKTAIKELNGAGQ